MNEELVISSAISDFSSKYNLTVIMEKGKFIMPSLEINKKFYWDNEEYLSGELIHLLTRWDNKATNEADLKELEELKQYIPEEDFLIVLEILKQGAEMGYFDNPMEN